MKKYFIIILIVITFSCDKNSLTESFCQNCDSKTDGITIVKNKTGWLIFDEKYNKYAIEVPYSNYPIAYIPCNIPSWFQTIEMAATVIFSGTVIGDPFITTDLIPITYYCIKIDTISFPKEFPDPNTLPKGLKGSWVETGRKTDTIVFTTNNDTGYFWLNRGYEMRNGYLLPLIGSGDYEYKIIPDSIKLRWGLSSELYTLTYYFNFDEPNLVIMIGKFVPFNTNQSILAFRKIR
jgi:hypothetical protein